MNPVLKYRGGKSREIPRFLQHLPSSYDRYIEPFFGGGALYFFLEPQKAIINDLNKRLINFYIQLQNNYDEMRKQLDEIQFKYEKNQEDYKKKKQITPNDYIKNNNEEFYYEMRNLFNNSTETSYLDGVIYFFINKTAYSGMIRYNSNGEYNVPFGRYPNLNTKLITEQHHNLLQGAEIFNLDYKEIFKMTKKDDFVFLDPPYDCVFNDYGNIDLMNGFDEQEHRRLAQDFKKLKCKALMVIGKTPLTMELYGDYVCDEYYKNYSVNIKNRFNNDKMHIVVKNY